MAFGGIFKLGSDIVQVGIEGNNLIFLDISSGTVTTVEGLQFSKSGVIKEFPDLKDDEEWKKKSIERLKEHMKKIESEMDKLIYVKNELNKFGWEALYYVQKGFRPKKF
jgi:hypothetical protein